MDIQFFGANCVRITTKKASVVIDDTLDTVGKKNIAKSTDIALFTSPHDDVPAALLTVDHPGEYEVADVSIQGIAARAHIDETGANATIYKISAGDVRVAVLGHIYPELSEEQLEQLGTVDILIVPVGGHGYTLDSLGALKCIKKIEPKVVIPTHYETAGFAYEVPQTNLEEAVKGLSMELPEPVDRLKVKSGDFSEGTTLTVLNVTN
jgi:L-ascorbate metabolism protein UlaG (beta-lactamase superfamily)